MEAYVRTRDMEHFVRSDGEAIEETVLYADPQILSVFSFPLLKGDTDAALDERHGVVISEKAALANPVDSIRADQ